MRGLAGPDVIHNLDNVNGFSAQAIRAARFIFSVKIMQKII